MNGRHVWIVAKKELAGINYEKTILFAILLQLFVAMFSSFLMVGLTSLYDPSSVSQYSRYRYSIAYAGANSSLLTRLEGSEDFTVYEMDLSRALESLKERQLAAVIFVPATLPEGDDPVQVTLYTLQNDIQATVVGVKLKEVLLAFEEDLRTARADRITAEPIEVQFPPSARAEGFYEFVYGLLIPLLMFMPAIISASLIIDLITEEYQHNTLETLISTPVSFTEMVWGKVLTCEILVPVQAAAWLLLLALNGIRIANPVPILILVSLASLILILLSALTALHYRERTAAQFIYSTALVVVILFVVAVPENPLNLIVRASVGNAGPGIVLAILLVSAAAALLGFLTHLYAGRVGKIPPAAS
ncbi:MAG TPA: ABC transporter permease [Methanomicrobiales archaeon]|jgi:ABC-type Na+ efflux pump permease subunit|nr:ABC transporter permease [Methanomicrobiales archaeon]